MYVHLLSGHQRNLPSTRTGAARQALYSLGLYLLPWCAARFLSGEPPGLFLMGRVIFRPALHATLPLLMSSAQTIENRSARCGFICSCPLRHARARAAPCQRGGRARRHHGRWRSRLDPDTLRVGCVHLALTVLPATLWAAAVTSRWCARAWRSRSARATTTVFMRAFLAAQVAAAAPLLDGHACLLASR